MFAVVGPGLWNSLPFYLRSLSSVHAFKSKLKSIFWSDHLSNLNSVKFLLRLVAFFAFYLVSNSVEHSGQLLFCLLVLYKSIK